MHIVDKRRELIITPIIIAILGVGIHFVSNYISNDFLKILFLTEETYFNHLKLYFTSFLILYILEYFTETRHIDNYLLSRVASMFTMMITTLVGSYLLLYLVFDGVNSIVAIALFIVSIMVGQLVATYVQSKTIRNSNIIAIIMQIIITVLLAYFTYFPIANSIFFITYS